jgi:DNA-binding GntR family transcriptional regulator
MALTNKGRGAVMQSLTASVDTKPSFPAGQGLDARGSRVGIICQSILHAVVEHRLPPGAKLTEEQLGAIFGASRTTVRSALQALAHDHIVTLAPHRSAFVSSPTIETARDIFAGRKLVEAAIAREAARRIDAAQVAELRALLSTERAALNRGDRPAAIRLSGAFHIAVAATCGEGVLTAFLRSLISRSSLVIALYGRSHASACGHDEHIALVSALGNREAESAARLMSDHLDHIFSDLDLNIREDNSVDLAAVLGARPNRTPLTTDLHRRAKPAPGGGYAKGHIG